MFVDEQIIGKFTHLTAEELQSLAKRPEDLRLFFVFLASGYIEADIGSPQNCSALIAVGGKKIPLPEALSSHNGLKRLTQNIIQCLEDNEKDAMGLIGTFELSA